MVLPKHSARVLPEGALINLATDGRDVSLRIEDCQPVGADGRLELPSGWQNAAGGEVQVITAPTDVTPGLYTVPVRVGGASAMTVQRIEHGHTAPTALSKPAICRVLALQADVPEVRVGYIGAGNDRVNHWLAALGADVTNLSDAELASDAALAGFDTLVIGIFAMRFRPGLAEAMPRIHQWVEAGGTLVTLYHRPWDNWIPEATPPRRLEIGQPSLRWRVTDETAAVRHLADHPVLTTPNPIGPEDWAGWVKERGLYFAKNWDKAYTPLIEMADPDEAPHRGALLVADIGQGRHVHTSLILHHQMEKLTSGAFRIMANLVAKPR